MEKHNKYSAALFSKVDETMLQLIKSDVETANEILSDADLNPEEELSKGLKLIKRLQFEIKAKINQEKDKSLMEKVFLKLKKCIEENLEKSGTMLISCLKEKAPNVEFRNLDKLDDDEIREILNDVDLAKLMEEMEDENDS